MVSIEIKQERCENCNTNHIYHDIGWILDRKKYEKEALALYELEYSLYPDCSSATIYNIAHIIRFQDRERAFKLFELVANPPVEDVDAMCLLGSMYLYKDFDKAIMWLTKGKDKGDAGCIDKLGDIYYFGRNANVNRPKAFDYYIEAAEMGHVPSIKMVARYYREGYDGCVEQNDHKEGEWLEKIPLKKMDNVTKFNFGWYCIRRNHELEKEKKGLKIMYELVNDIKDKDAMYMIGECFRLGKADLDKDDNIALEWYCKSANAGDYAACIKIVDDSSGEIHLEYIEKAIRIRNDDKLEHRYSKLYPLNKKISVETGALINILKRLDNANAKLEEYEMRPPLIGGKLFREARQRFNKGHNVE